MTIKSYSGDIVSFSDVHLGWERCNKKRFNQFLDYLHCDKDLGYIVALGDILDYWRRDDAGVTFENADTIHKLIELGEKRRITWVLGNHDWHLTTFHDHEYPFEFPEKLVIKTKDQNYRFVHGHQFDPVQFPFLFEPLCQKTNDSWGSTISNLWDASSLVKEVCGNLLLRVNKPRYSAMMATPQERGNIKVVEENAKNSVRDNEYLIYGHTHNPYVDDQSKTANCGSWVNRNNTYVRISNGKIKLEEF